MSLFFVFNNRSFKKLDLEERAEGIDFFPTLNINTLLLGIQLLFSNVYIGYKAVSISRQNVN